MDEDPIYYITGNKSRENGWSYAKSWPLPDSERKSLFLSAGKSGTASSINDGMLSETTPEDEEGADVYKVIYDICENIDNHTETVDRDSKGVTYTSETLQEDMEVTGHPLMELWVSTTSDDGDFIVHLIDVDEEGRGTYITDGKLRASLRNVSEPPYDFMGLPWHRCNRADEHKLIPGRPYKLQMDLMPMSHLFRKGHRIRVTVTCACQKVYFVRENEAPRVTFYRNTIHTSYITLPVTANKK